MNTFSGIAHTARHVSKAGATRSLPPRAEAQGGISDEDEVVRKLRPVGVIPQKNLANIGEAQSKGNTEGSRLY